MVRFWCPSIPIVWLRNGFGQSTRHWHSTEGRESMAGFGWEHRTLLKREGPKHLPFQYVIVMSFCDKRCYWCIWTILPLSSLNIPLPTSLSAHPIIHTCLLSHRQKYGAFFLWSSVMQIFLNWAFRSLITRLLHRSSCNPFHTRPPTLSIPSLKRNKHFALSRSKSVKTRQFSLPFLFYTICFCAFQWFQ